MRLLNPRMQPPAWLHFLHTLYSGFPPRSLSTAQAHAEAAQLASVAPMSAEVLRALRRSLVLYHPDKNRRTEHGAEWAQLAEEISKLASMLLEHYRRRIDWQRAAAGAQAAAAAAPTTAEGSGPPPPSTPPPREARTSDSLSSGGGTTGGDPDAAQGPSRGQPSSSATVGDGSVDTGVVLQGLQERSAGDGDG